MSNLTQANLEIISRQSYTVGQFLVITIPLDTSGCVIQDDENNKYVFINSKLPRAERSSVVRSLIQKAEVWQ